MRRTPWNHIGNLSRRSTRRTRAAIAAGILALVAAGAAGAAGFAALSWNNSSGGAASTATNWTPNQVPTSADDLTFNILGSYSVTFNASTPASRSHAYRRGFVGVTASSPHTLSNGITVAPNAGDVATVTFTTGDVVSNGAVAIGSVAGTTGTLNVNDDDADLLLATAAGDMTVGVNGNGNLNVTGGGRVQVADRFVSGSNSTATGDISVTGIVFAPAARSWLDVLGTTTASTIGSGGDVTMTVTDGGLATFAGSLNVAQGSTSASTLTVGGSGTSAANAEISGDLRVAGNTTAGSSGGFGVVSVGDLGVLDVAGTLHVGDDPDGGTGFLALETGGAITTGSLAVGPTGELDLDGGTLDIDGGAFSYSNPTVSLIVGGPERPRITLENGASGTLAAGPGGRALTVGGMSGSDDGDLDITSGSSLVITGGDVVLGETPGNLGMMKVTGSGSALTMAPEDDFVVAKEGSGMFTAELGAQVVLGNVMISRDATGTGYGSAIFSNAGTVVEAARIAVGGSPTAPGGAGELFVVSGASCEVSGPGGNVVVWPDGQLHVYGGSLSADTVRIEGEGEFSDATVAANDFVIANTDVMATGTLGGRVHLATATSTLTATFDDLIVGDASDPRGFRNSGVLDCGDDTVTILDLDAAEIGTTRLSGGSLVVPNGATLSVNDSISGFGTVDADVANLGTIASVVPGLTFKGIVSGVGQGFSGFSAKFEDGGGFVGSGTIASWIYGDSTSTFTATGDLVMGSGVASASVAIDGSLDVGSHTVALADEDSVYLGGTTTIDGGALIATHIVLKSGGVIEGAGTVGARIVGHENSRITATGDLAIGDVAAPEFATTGVLEVGANAVTILTGGLVDLGRSTTIAGGTLSHTGTNSFFLEDGDSLTGWGAVNNSTRLDGTAFVRADGPLTFDAATGSAFVGESGTLDVNSNTVTILGTGSLYAPQLTTIRGGALSAQNTNIASGKTFKGFGTVFGEIDNSGLLEIGDPIGTLVVNGDVDNMGTIAVQVGGSGAAPNAARAGEEADTALGKSQSVVCDLLQVSGTADLDAFGTVTTLRVGQLPGLVVEAGDRFTIIIADSIAGTFDQIVFDDPYLDDLFDVQYATTRVTLVATATTSVDLPPIGDATGGAPGDESGIGGAVPDRFGLRLASSNPFLAHAGVAFQYDVPRGGGPVAIAVFDASGRRVADLVSGTQGAGTHAERWTSADLRALPSGVYFLCMDAGAFRDTKRLVMLR